MVLLKEIAQFVFHIFTLYFQTYSNGILTNLTLPICKPVPQHIRTFPDTSASAGIWHRNGASQALPHLWGKNDHSVNWVIIDTCMRQWIGSSLVQVMADQAPDLYLGILLSTHWGLVTYICFCELGKYWFKRQLLRWPSTSRFVNQWWLLSTAPMGLNSW